MQLLLCFAIIIISIPLACLVLYVMLNAIFTLISYISERR